MPAISEIQNLRGANSEIIDEWASITGEVTYVGASVTGYIQFDDCEVTGYVTMPESEAIEIYTGITNVIPSTRNDILLETERKKVLENITVYKISYSEVTNESGGYTVTIGEE